MNKATVTRGIRAYRDLLAEISERQQKADKIREWLAVHADHCEGRHTALG